MSPMFPDSMILGMEIRVKVSQYVVERIKALRANQPDCYNNIACIRTNAIKYLPNFFKKGQVSSLRSYDNCCTNILIFLDKKDVFSLPRPPFQKIQTQVENH